MNDACRDIARSLARKYGVLSPEGLDHLSAMLKPMRLKRGTKVLEAGSVCQHIYYVERGLIRQSYVSGGKTFTEHIAYEGGMVMCLESLFKGEPSAISIETLEPSMLYAIPYETFRKLSMQRYEYCEFLFNIFKESLIVSQHKMALLRIENAKERYLQMLNDHPDIIRRTPLHLVATYLRMTPETLSRIRTSLSEESA